MTRRTQENRLASSRGAEAPRDEVYARAFGRALKQVQRRADLFQQESREAEAALEEILSQPLARRYLLMRNSSRFRSWLLGDRLLQYSEEKWFGSPTEALEVADLVRFAAHHLNPEEGEGITEDLRARAWAYRGNCLRILGDLIGAEAAFAVAQRCRSRGTGDALLAARLTDLEASLRSAQGLYGEALSLQRRAFVIYTRAGDRHQQGRNLIGQGKVQLDQGNPTSAEWLLRRGLRWIDISREPRLAMVARHNLVCCAIAAGEPGRARVLLKACRRDFQMEVGEAMESRRDHLELLLDKALAEVAADPVSLPSVTPEDGEERRPPGRRLAPSRA